MKYVEDSALTEKQQKLKFYLYCEIEFENDKDIKAVLNSLLKDIQ